MTGADIVLKHTGTYLAKAGSTALGTIRSVEYTVQNLEELSANIRSQIGETQKRIADLKVHQEQPFEYEERLASLSCRQDEIETALDLTKNQASAQLGDSVETVVPGDSPSQVEPGEEIQNGGAMEIALA